VNVGRLERAVEHYGKGLVHRGKKVQAREEGRGVDEGIFEVAVPRQELRLEISGVGHISEQTHIHPVGVGDMFEMYLI
jgi:hypothetical protein